MDSVELRDMLFNSVWMTPKIVTLDSREGDGADEADIESLRNLPWFGKTIAEPEEIWFIRESIDGGGKAYLNRYIALFENENCEREVVVVSAMLIRPGEYHVVRTDIFPEKEFDNDRWRYGIPLFSRSLKAHDSKHNIVSGISWEESIRDELFNCDMFIVRDAKGKKHTFSQFVWSEKDGLAFLDMRVNKEEFEEIDAGIHDCMKSPDKVVTRPMIHPDTGEIVEIQVLYKRNQDKENDEKRHQFATAIIGEDEGLEVVDYFALSDSEDRERMFDGVVIYDKNNEELPVYVATPKGYLDRKTGDLIDTQANINSIPHPFDPSKKLWIVMVFRSPMEDPPFVVDVRYLDNEEDLKAFRKGDLIYHHN